MSKLKRNVILIVSFVLVLTMGLAGCSTGNGGGSSNGGQNRNGNPSANDQDDDGSGNDEPVTVTIVTQQVNEVPQPGNPVELAIEEMINADLDIQWTPSTAYDDKVSVMIASGELPDVLTISYSATYLPAVRDGQFWEIGPYMGELSNMSAMNPMYFDNIKVDGKLYGIPIFRNLARSGIVYRKDWFDRFGLDIPTTTDEWYEAVKAMVENDPDQDGNRNTWGLMLDKNFVGGMTSGLNRLAVSLGAPNMWGESDGQLVPNFMTNEYREVLRLFRRLYAEKLINQDFAITETSTADDAWRAGKVGIQVTTVNNAYTRSEELKELPGAVVDAAALTGPDGRRAAAESGNNGFLVFPKSTVGNEDELRRLLQVFDRMLDPDVATLLSLGIEGTHWERDGEFGVWKDYDKFYLEVKPYRDRLINMEDGGSGVPLKREPIDQKAREITLSNLDYAVKNPALTLYSPTYTDRGAELDILIKDAQIKYIMNEIDEEGFEQEVQRWLDAGGQKVIEEYTEAYKANGS